ncbi:MAG: helix-turn-helix transcriptional regulator [Geminicoccaceae bacterium]
MEALRGTGDIGSRFDTRQIDQHIGRRLRDRRVLCGLTQHELAEIVGLSFQQLHKYEKGTNRIAIGRLFALAGALDVTVDFFYEGLGTSDESPMPPMSRKAVALVRNFNTIEDPDQQLSIYRMAKLLADEE